MGNIKSEQVTSNEKRWVSGELGLCVCAGWDNRELCDALKAVTYSQSMWEGWQDAWWPGSSCRSKGSYSSMVVHWEQSPSWKQNPSWAWWSERECSTWTGTRQSWAGPGRALSWCKVLLLPVCCAGMLLISRRVSREGQERGRLYNVLYSKTQNFMCEVNTVFLSSFFPFVWSYAVI